MDDRDRTAHRQITPGRDLDGGGFRPRPPWWGGDLQTVRNSLRTSARRPAPPPSDRLALDLEDGSGDRLIGALSRPRPYDSAVRGRPLVVLLHGLSGSEQSAYMRIGARWFAARGYPVLRLNLRGAGPSGAWCRFDYHAGRSDDLARALAALPAALTADGVAVVGFSLGGNMLLKFLGEAGKSAPVIAAATISAPIDLFATSRSIRRPRNALYQRAMLRDFARQCLRPAATLGTAEAAAVRAARNFYQIDRDFVAPRNGFASAEDYYRRSMALPHLAAITVPTLVIHARDDPIVPAAAYQAYGWRGNPALTPLLPKRGGHVGFHGRGGVWYLHRFAEFLERITGAPP